jgi:hypothetical protein
MPSVKPKSQRYPKAPAQTLSWAFYNAETMRRNESSMDAQYFENSWPVVCLGGLFGREAVARCIRFHGGQDISATRPTGSATGSTAAPGKAIEGKTGSGKPCAKA